VPKDQKQQATVSGFITASFPWRRISCSTSRAGEVFPFAAGIDGAPHPLRDFRRLHRLSRVTGGKGRRNGGNRVNVEIGGLYVKLNCSE
jgi:hypothetical protein